MAAFSYIIVLLKNVHLLILFEVFPHNRCFQNSFVYLFSHFRVKFGNEKQNFSCFSEVSVFSNGSLHKWGSSSQICVSKLSFL